MAEIPLGQTEIVGIRKKVIVAGSFSVLAASRDNSKED
jgi:hypothetical protein